MKHIYNELIQYKGKLYEFAYVMVQNKMYSNEKAAVQRLKHGVTHRQDIQDLYDSWKNGKLKTKDINKYNEKVSNVFKDIKKTKVKKELESIVEVLEESLKELTIAIKNDDKSKLLEAKEMLENALYGD